MVMKLAILSIWLKPTPPFHSACPFASFFIMLVQLLLMLEISQGQVLIP